MNHLSYQFGNIFPEWYKQKYQYMYTFWMQIQLMCFSVVLIAQQTNRCFYPARIMLFTKPKAKKEPFFFHIRLDDPDTGAELEDQALDHLSKTVHDAVFLTSVPCATKPIFGSCLGGGCEKLSASLEMVPTFRERNAEFHGDESAPGSVVLVFKRAGIVRKTCAGGFPGAE